MNKTIVKNEIIKENINEEIYVKFDGKIEKTNIDISGKLNYMQNSNMNINIINNKIYRKMRIKIKIKKKKIIKKNNPPKKNISIYKMQNLNNNHIKNIKESKNSNIKFNLSNCNSLINKKSNNKIMKISEFNNNKKKLDNYELNNLEYDSARKYDKRNFINIYWSLLKREHMVIFTFITRDDHNITFVKYSRFFFLLCTDMAMNVFFFADETMHKIFLDYGKFNFIQQIPQVIYSTIVSQIIEIFICFLSLTDKYFYEIKECNGITKAFLMKIMTCIKVKITIFYVFTFLMFIFYWYFITCFCAVYPNTQIAFIKDFLSSFALGIFLPFILYIFPSIFRIISLKSKSNIEYVYKFSNLIPFF